MLKLEESPRCESLRPGSILKINNIDMGEQGKTNLLFLRNQGLLSNIPKKFCPGLSEKFYMFSEQILLRQALLLNLSLSDYHLKLVKTW